MHHKTASGNHAQLEERPIPRDERRVRPDITRPQLNRDDRTPAQGLPCCSIWSCRTSCSCFRPPLRHRTKCVAQDSFLCAGGVSCRLIHRVGKHQTGHRALPMCGIRPVCIRPLASSGMMCFCSIPSGNSRVAFFVNGLKLSILPSVGGPLDIHHFTSLHRTTCRDLKQRAFSAFRRLLSRVAQVISIVYRRRRLPSSTSDS